MIKIIKGSYGKREGNVVKAVGPGTVLELEPAQEERLVKIGVATFVTEDKPTAPVEPPKTDEGEEDGGTIPEVDESMKFKDLRDIAVQLGIDVTGLKSKKEVIEAIKEAKELQGGFGGSDDVVVDE